jgi:hypothetical protein
MKVISHVTRRCLFGLLALPFIARKAWAHNPLTHVADNYSNAKSKQNGRCCDGADYTYVLPRDWERKKDGGGYRAFVDNQWIDIPADAEVDNMKNPDGYAKIWLMDQNGKRAARCFMPGAES